MKTYTDGELRQASDHIWYEYWMMNMVVEVLNHGFVGIQDNRFVSSTHAPTSITITGMESGIEAFPIPTSDEKNMIINNVLIEAFGIHARNLMNFFYPNRDWMNREDLDDIIADYYFDNNNWDHRPEKPKIHVNRLVNKNIAHLTFERIKVTSKDWGYQFICNEINRVVCAFRAGAKGERLGQRWT
jgi:hypothetical protein